MQQLVIRRQIEADMTIIDDSLCPLCQQKNACGINNPEACWCTKADIDQALLAQVPKAQARKACICQQCITKFNQAKIINKS